MTVITARPSWSAYDPAQGRDVALYLYACECGRQHNSPDASVPAGWDVTYLPQLGETAVHCPDCLEAIEQKKSAELCDKIGIHPTEPRKPTTPAPFALHLQRQQEGGYLIAMTPETALMRLSPLEFYLSAEDARSFAWDLLRHADLIDAPGTLPASFGVSK